MTDQPELNIGNNKSQSGFSEKEKEAYRNRLQEYLEDPNFREIEGFPIGEDADILALSDPPYYTACPNPFIGEITEKWREERSQIRKALGLPDDTTDNGEGSITYKREPFASDVSEGKNNPIYNAHSYHTKVPHKAIMRYILHYTDPGDIILDGFCGSGMTGVAAQLCGSKKDVEILGYKVKKNGEIADEDGKIFSKIGVRKSVLIDLCPAATFIAYNYNTPIDVHSFEGEANRILEEVEKEFGWMYETWHPHCDDPNRVKGRINYTVWSDVFLCPHCGARMTFWNVAVDHKNNKIHKVWDCPDCHSRLSKRPPKDSRAIKVERIFDNRLDRALGEKIRQAKQEPVIINYSVGRSRFVKRLDEDDHKLLRNISENEIPYKFPINRMPSGEESRRNDDIGITHSHHFYTRRNIWILSALHKRLRKSLTTLFLFNSQLSNLSKLNRYRPSVSFPYNPLSGTLYISSQVSEANPFIAYRNKIRRIKNGLILRELTSLTQNYSASTPNLLSDNFDYLFIDPPFGDNLMYSELNFLSESWLGVFTNNQSEAIINKEQNKNLSQYQALMENCFKEFYRVLKPGRWMTVEFHNSKNAVWTAIQEGILRAGFMVADVRTLDKQQGTFKQVTSSGAVKQDLIISAYKPRHRFEEQFKLEGGSEKGMWKFVQQHLVQLPLPNLADGLLEPLQERMPFLLYDRMVAFHVQRGLTVPLSAADFYQGLAQKYLERDGMVFTSAQASQYDSLRMQADRVEQLSLFIKDEVSARQWIRQELDPESGNGPQTYREVQPRFMQADHHVKHEDLPELKELLEQNFILDSEDRWCVPDPHKQADMEKLRTNALLREFNDYIRSKGKLRVFRSEAVRAGFSRAWSERDYQTIVTISERIPNKVLQEDAQMLMYYQNASQRLGEQPRQPKLL